MERILQEIKHIKLTTYLGQKGYTILKSELTPIHHQIIRDELTITPYVPGAPVSIQQKYIVYRENANKMYLPRYFGEKHFGPPTTVKVTQGMDIDVPFAGTLREHQVPIVDAYMAHMRLKGESGSGLIEACCAAGKTVLTLKIISLLQKKTIVIVHKEFLMNQWIERIREFLPTARIGRIQGPIIDVKDKDIVLVMLQSLSKKIYSESTFDEFGLTVIDECHHISSEVFSNALFKLVTKYMLGLSATMNRKDGTTKVFKMFLGEVVYKTSDVDDHEVVVRGVTYKSSDDDFNAVAYDYRGNPQFSTMISKLCAYNGRSEFILRIVHDLLTENSKQQIMILAHNRCLLKYFFDSIQHHGIADGSVGYYVGGMKEKDLKVSETRRIVLATYSMAAEALDIKTLTTLIMATPKTDIKQAVGRILRERHSRPIVVDIIDSHSIFQNQWRKRRQYYKAQNYKIIETDSTKYTTDLSRWRTSFSPSGMCIHPGLGLVADSSGSSSGSSGSNGSSSSSSGSNTSTANVVVQQYDDDNESDIEDDSSNSSRSIFGGKCVIKINRSP